MPPVIAIVAGISLTSILTSIAISVVSDLVIMGVSQLLGGNNQPAASVQPQTITVKEPLAPWKVIYGRARVGGAWVYIHTTGNPVIGENSALMGAIVLACHQCDAIEKIFFGDQEVPLDSTGNAMGMYRNFVHIWKHLGTGDQAADPELIRWGDGTWTSQHRLLGMCYIAIDLAYNKDLFPSMPVISAQVRGKIVLDHRDGGLRWTNNPVLCISDYLRDTRFGMGFHVSDLNFDSFNAEANACDEIVKTAAVGGHWSMPQVSFTAQVSKSYNANASTSKTIAGAFTLASEALAVDTGDMVMLSGAALPPPLVTNTPYYVIRQTDGNDYVYQSLNIQQTPVIQLAASASDAAAGTALTITHDGSGTMWRTDQMWLLGVDAKGFNTGDSVQVSQYDENPLPAPLTQNGAYYWISYDHHQQNLGSIHDIVEVYGRGMVASSLENALAKIPIALTSVGASVYNLARFYEKRWTCNGVVDTSNKPSDILGQLLSCCGGKLVRAGDEWNIFTAIWRGIGTSLTDHDLRGPLKVATLVSRRDVFNGVRGTYISPANFDQPQDFPPYPDPNRPDEDIFMAQDGGERIWSQDIQLAFTNSPSMAQRLAKVLLMQMRQQVSIVFPARLTAFNVTVAQNINVTLPRMGWTDKVFEVVDWTLVLEGGGSGKPPNPGIDLTLRETDPSVYEWDNGAETTGWWVARPDLPTALIVAVPVIVSATESRYVTATGAGQSSGVTVTWNPVGDAASYQVTYADASGNQITLPVQSAGQGNSAFIGPLTKGSYTAQVRTINLYDVASAWSDPFPFTVVGVVGPPPDLLNFLVTAVYGQAHVTWDQSPDQDVINGGNIWIRWSPAIGGATWATATGLSQLLAGSATEATVPLQAGSYLGKAVDSAGNQSVTAAVWVVAAVDSSGLELLMTNTEDPGFAGSKTNLTVTSGVLQLTTVSGDTTMDTWPSVDPVANWDAEGALNTSGEYDFNTVTDLGAVFGFHMELDMTAVGVGTSTLGDLTGATITAQISTTTTDPAGTPTWSAWAPLLVGDFTGRGVRRRLLFTTNEYSYSLGCSALTDKISMPTRTWTDSAVALASGGTRVNFTPAFYAAPDARGYPIGAGPGAYVDVTLVDRQGATFTIRNSGGSGISGTADLYAFGAGSEV
jgi:hypothetical protein